MHAGLRMIAVLVLSAFSAHGAPFVEAGASALEAGWAKVEITPPFAAPLAGFGERWGASYQGVNDPLYVRAIVTAEGSEKIALASADLVVINRALREEVVKRLAAKRLKFSALALMATHTHSGFGGYWDNTIAAKTSMGKFDEKIFDFVATRITEAIAQADGVKVPARVGHGSVNIPGSVRNRRDTSKPIDPVLSVIRIDDLQGNPKAALVNFAAHATMLGAKNLSLSADYPGALSAALEKQLAVALFTVGAAGDSRPMSVPGATRFEKAQTYGQMLADKAFGVLRGIQTREKVEIKSRTAEIDLPPATLYGAVGFASVVFDPFFRRYVPTTTLLQAIRLNDTVLTAWPTEPVAAIGIDFKNNARARFGIELPIIAALANDYIGYMQTEKDFSKWGYETSASFFGPKLAQQVTGQMFEILQRVR